MSRLLAGIALMAAQEGRLEQAARIFDALCACHENDPEIGMCMAMVLSAMGRGSECFSLLNSLRKSHPEHASLKALHGYLLFSAGEPGWEAMMADAAESEGDASARSLALAVLEEQAGGRTMPTGAGRGNPVPYA
jgi:thioredoxin-like negative regulator of GroEL